MTSVATLPSWTLGSPLLEIVEQSTVSASDELVNAIVEHRWTQLGLVVRKSPGAANWTVRASDVTGVARIDVAGRLVPLRVTPKIDGLDLFFLADWAYGSKGSGKTLDGVRTSLAALRSEPAACLLGWYVAEVLAFATRWLRRGYVVREEDLIGRVRGRIDVARYLSHSLALARPHSIPSRFTEPSRDTPANRYLKAGLREVAILTRSVPLPEARVALDELTRRSLSLFAGVEDTRAKPQDALRLNLSGPLRHYSPIVRFTTALLSGAYVSTELGEHDQDAIMWSLNGLYESALGKVLDAWPGAVSMPGRHRATLVHANGHVNGSTPVKPDYVMRRADGAHLVLDAKYKSVLPAAYLASGNEDAVDLSVARGQRVRVRRSDIYQVVAYARHSGLHADRVVLLYPVALGPGDSYPEPLHVREFDPTCHIVFFDVGERAETHRSDLYRALDAL